MRPKRSFRSPVRHLFQKTLPEFWNDFLSSHPKLLLFILSAVVLLLALLIIFLFSPTHSPSRVDIGSLTSYGDFCSGASTESQSSAVAEGEEESQEETSESTPAKASYDLNTITREELISLPGIGEAKADAILQMRDALGGFSNLSQLLDVDGIGEATYEQIVPYLYIGS